MSRGSDAYSQPRSWERTGLVARIHGLTYDLTRRFARLLAVIAFSIRCHGRRHVPGTGGILFCANHQSHLDPILVGLCSDRELFYLARHTLFRYRAFAALIRWYNAIPIERDGRGVGGLKQTLRLLRDGRVVLIFPEGTRSPDGRLQPLRPGFTALVRRSGVPVVPIAIEGAFAAWPRARRWPRPARVRVTFGPAMWPAEIADWTDAELEGRLKNALAPRSAAWAYEPDSTG